MFKFRNILFVGILIAAFMTNPSESTFKSEIENQIIKEMKLNKEQNIVGEALTSKLLESLLWAFVRVDYRDYKLCSTFEIKMGSKNVKFFGIFGQVIPLSGKESLTELKMP
jgi:hypothetical protein